MDDDGDEKYKIVVPSWCAIIATLGCQTWKSSIVSWSDLGCGWGRDASKQASKRASTHTFAFRRHLFRIHPFFSLSLSLTHTHIVFSASVVVGCWLHTRQQDRSPNETQDKEHLKHKSSARLYNKRALRMVRLDQLMDCAGGKAGGRRRWWWW